MESRAKELRARGRRIFWFSMVGAGVIHGAIFIGLQRHHVDVSLESAIRDEVEGESRILDFIDVHFGPPEIFRDDGTIWQEPPERVLEARNVELLEINLPPECGSSERRGIVPAQARLRLELNAAGRVTNAELAPATGNPCRDGMMTAIAERLWYHWLPNRAFAAPVELIQPMMVVAAVAGADG
jgi:hypothetical protein